MTPPSHRDFGRRGPLRLLVVDDDDGMRRSLGRTLSRRGHEVIVCSDGPEALAAIDAGTPVDAAVLDLQMLPMDGVALFRALKQRQPDLPIGFFSASGALDSLPDDVIRAASFRCSKLEPVRDLLDALDDLGEDAHAVSKRSGVRMRDDGTAVRRRKSS